MRFVSKTPAGICDAESKHGDTAVRVVCGVGRAEISACTVDAISDTRSSAFDTGPPPTVVAASAETSVGRFVDAGGGVGLRTGCYDEKSEASIKVFSCGGLGVRHTVEKDSISRSVGTRECNASSPRRAAFLEMGLERVTYAHMSDAGSCDTNPVWP